MTSVYWTCFVHLKILSLGNFEDLPSIEKNGEYPEDLFIVLL